MKLPRNAKVFRGQLDVAPFIGVFFLLLILVILKNFVTFVPGVPVRLPESSNFAGFRGPAVAVIVNAGGQFFFADRELKLEEMQSQLSDVVSASEEPLTLIVQADTNVPYGTLMQLNAMAQQAGIRDVFHAVKPASQP
jgi:biopolymer transport protein ExbD